MDIINLYIYNFFFDFKLVFINIKIIFFKIMNIIILLIK